MKNKSQTTNASLLHRGKQHLVTSIQYPPKGQAETRLKGILFDFDGVVLDSMKQHVKAWQYAFAKQGVKLTELDIYMMEGMGVKAVVETVCEKYNLPMKLVSELMQIKSEYYKKHLQIKFYKGFFELLDYLKLQKLKLAVVTGGDRSRIIPFAKKYLNGYFKDYICSDDVKDTKPSPEPYLKGLEILGLDSSECLVIENAPLGIQAAKAAGIKTIAIETTLGKKYLQEADLIVQTFLEIQLVIEKMLNK